MGPSRTKTDSYPGSVPCKNGLKSWISPIKEWTKIPDPVPYKIGLESWIRPVQKWTLILDPSRTKKGAWSKYSTILYYNI